MTTQNSVNRQCLKAVYRQRSTLSRLVGLVCLIVSVGASTQVQTPEQAPIDNKKTQPVKQTQSKVKDKQDKEAKPLDAVADPAEVPAEKTSEERVFSLVTEQAKSLAAKSYVAPKQDLPAELAEMNYQQYRAIRFNPEKAQWKNKAKFEMQLFLTMLVL